MGIFFSHIIGKETQSFIDYINVQNNTTSKKKTGLNSHLPSYKDLLPSVQMNLKLGCTSESSRGLVKT